MDEAQRNVGINAPDSISMHPGYLLLNVVGKDQPRLLMRAWISLVLIVAGLSLLAKGLFLSLHLLELGGSLTLIFALGIYFSSPSRSQLQKSPDRPPKTLVQAEHDADLFDIVVRTVSRLVWWFVDWFR